MIAVNVGDVVEVRTYPGYSFRVTHIENNSYESDKSVYLCEQHTPTVAGGPHGVRHISPAAVSRNITTGEGCEQPKRSASKYHYATRFNGYELDLGAETLPELYALMAAAGVKFTPVIVPPDNEPVSQESWDSLTEFINKGTMSRVEAMPHTPIPHDPTRPSAYADTLGAATIVPPQTAMYVADETQPKSAFNDRLGDFFGVPTQPFTIGQSYSSRPLFGDDTDPQPHVVGS
jgi:hypothetical protein